MSIRVRPAWRSRILPAILLTVLLCACGYHTEGHGALAPNIRTIAIPVFKNQTPAFRIEQQLTAAVKRELMERTSYRVTANPAGADAVLKGTVEEVRQGVIVFNPQSGSASALQVEVVVGITLTDLASKKVLFANPHYVFREQYQISSTASTLIQEDPAALGRLSRDFARTLVTDILENF